ncbi:MAG TPA: serine hydrolase domain-containing protein [Pyrinomonadaceae bacterium]|nr:serine hydrolase domain-containing protein [Pyrinomonadaceae bacterium]
MVMYGLKKIAVLFVFHGAAIHALSQAPVVDSAHREAIEQARQITVGLASEQKIPGLAIAVSVDNKIVWSEGFGFADLENRIPVTTKTRFRIGSISKLLTAAAAAKLHEQGALDLDAPIQKYLPSYPQKEFSITSRHLLGHLAGIRHYRRNDYVNQRRFESVSDSLAPFKDDPLLHRPESRYAYSSYGFVLLSAVLESASGENFSDLLQKMVFTQLGMNDTQVDDNRNIIANRSAFYSKNSEGQINNEIYMDTSDRIAAGGFLSTAEDLARFGAACLSDQFLRPDTRAVVFTSQKTTDGKPTGVGLGWRIATDSEKRTIYHHGGDSIGGRAFSMVYPQSRVVIAVASNLSFARISEKEVEGIADLFVR